MPEAAPEPDTRPDHRSGRDRLRQSLTRPSRGQAVVAVLVGVLAFSGVTQVRQTRSHDVYAGMREADLVQALNGLSAAANRAQSDITILQRTRDALLNKTQRRGTAIAQARREVNALGILAGTVPAIGPGVQITVTEDPARRLQVNYLLDGVEELRDAGAEAMQINGVRVVAQTSFEDGTGGILVDGKQLTSPYLIDAVGNPTGLTKAVNFPGGFRDDAALDNASLKSTRSQRVLVGATVVPRPARYAQPVPPG